VRPERWAPYYPRGVVTHHITPNGEVAFGSEGTYSEPVYYPDRTQGRRVFGPDEYFVLGDNSTSSQDSRAWGQVPERLLMGKAVVVYFPFWPFGSSRLGLIR
jgi:type IV secretory pathway protease TraF